MTAFIGLMAAFGMLFVVALVMLLCWAIAVTAIPVIGTGGEWRYGVWGLLLMLPPLAATTLAVFAIVMAPGLYFLYSDRADR